MSEEPVVWIVTEEEIHEPIDTPGKRSGLDTGGGFGVEEESVLSKVLKKRIALSQQSLKHQMNQLIQVVADVFNAPQSTQLGMYLDEVELSVEINSEGQISIVGSGAKMAGKGAIKLKFKRGAVFPDSNG